jgi:hypothetical protein
MDMLDVAPPLLLLCRCHSSSHSLPTANLCPSYHSHSTTSIRPIMSRDKGGYVKAKREFDHLSRTIIGTWPEDEAKWLWNPIAMEVNTLAQEGLTPAVNEIEKTFCEGTKKASDLADLHRMASECYSEPITDPAAEADRNCRKLSRKVENLLAKQPVPRDPKGTRTNEVRISQGLPSFEVITGHATVEVSVRVGFVIERISRDVTDRYYYLRTVTYSLSIEQQQPDLKRNYTPSFGSFGSARTSQRASDLQESIWTSPDSNGGMIFSYEIGSYGQGDESSKLELEQLIGKIVGRSSSSLPPRSTLENSSTLYAL